MIKYNYLPVHVKIVVGKLRSLCKEDQLFWFDTIIGHSNLFGLAMPL
jgi:hypothetical protein